MLAMEKLNPNRKNRNKDRSQYKGFNEALIDLNLHLLKD